MSSERYNQIIDEAYENYLKGCENLSSKVLLSDMQTFYKGPITPGPQDSRKIASPYPIEQFINKCKTDPEFSEKWRLKIEERELSREERYVWYKANTHLIPPHFLKQAKEFEDKYVPIKLITLTYNNETIESYE
jgi:hypothetical protein